MTGRPVVPPLLEYIPKVTPWYQSPKHLAPVLVPLDSSRHARIDDCGSCPPRHGKTDGILHYITRALQEDPRDSIAYFTYNYTQAYRKSRDGLDIADRAGLRLKQRSLDEWRTPEGGRVYWGGVRGTFTGVGVRLLIIDDPHKDRLEAESPTIRNHIWEWFTDTAYSRIEPGGSCLVNMARWHTEDLVGKLTSKASERLMQERGVAFRHTNLPAIAVSDGHGRRAGEALWPERWPVAELRRKKWNDYTWSSLYQGNPVPRGGALFKNAYSYDRALLDKMIDGFRWGMGLDFAYTKQSYSDYNVIVKGRRWGGRIYITGVFHEQLRMPDFLPVVKRWYEPGGMVVRAYIGGGAETFVGETIQAKLGAYPVEVISTTTDKYSRAQTTAEAWNEGRILVPSNEEDSEWVTEFLEEVNTFTGLDDDHDDQVDALVGLHDGLMEGIELPVDNVTLLRRRM